MTTTNPTMDISLRDAVAAERGAANALDAEHSRGERIHIVQADAECRAARLATDAAVTRAEAIEAALRECLNAITAGGPPVDVFTVSMYETPFVKAADVERWRAALGESAR